MVDLGATAQELARLVVGVRTDQLTAATPCADTSLGALLDHVDGLSLAFTLAAGKDISAASGRPPSADAAQLVTDWRSRIPHRLTALAEAWRDGSAWTGMTRVGGVDLPGEVAGVVGLNEIVVHGWDIATASGQQPDYEPAALQAAYEFVRASVAQNPNGTPGLFGPPVHVPESAPLLDRLIGLTGRNPQRSPSGAALGSKR